MRRNALLSVSDKTDLLPFARVLAEAGHTLLSTGGTARALREGGLEVVDVSAFTGAPEMMDGRVKTLHPRIHGGILGLREAHAEAARQHGIEWIDVVVVNLYPFEATAASGAPWDEVIENIDIGGPSMVRSAAKNHASVTIVTSPADYARVGEAIRAGDVPLSLRRELALAAFRHTARYDATISAWFAREAGLDAELPAETALPLTRLQPLRYGENPHQSAAFYGDGDPTSRSLARMKQHQGKELSYNNLADLDGAVRAVFEHEPPAAVVIKHANPCGSAVAHGPTQAFVDALSADPVSAYGGIVAFNRPVDGDTVAAIKRSKTFFEVLAAPGFTADALERLSTREKLRVIELPADFGTGRPAGRDAKRVMGGWLVQDWDLGAPVALTVATKRAPTEAEERALRFAWATCRSVKSNAITLATATPEGAVSNGVGAGQMSRVDSVRLA
ncbi:MAG: bifunctional phosphoribosylaminoimidazolecarboxamide formyltransferase/IMP cyclohydrolase, partial [Myxococcales bacterium]|nr:bifunctional phosphoribosylaminoimidazolecarboxamide formyltransferase/IMP cyclohydrolase [Myxococcales bacterium]